MSQLIKKMKRDKITFIPIFNAPVGDDKIIDDKPLQDVIELILNRIDIESLRDANDVHENR